MKKLFFSFITLVVFASSVAYADYRKPRAYHYPQQNHSRGRWVAPLIGGMIVGGLGSYYYYNRPTRCWDEPVVDLWNRIVGYNRYCE